MAIPVGAIRQAGSLISKGLNWLIGSGQNNGAISNASNAIANIATAANALSSGRNGGTSLYKSSNLMKAQTRWNEYYAKWYQDTISANQYATERKSLENAGYNPMLAYMNGTSGVPAGSTSANASYSSDGLASASMLQALSNAELARAEAEKVRAEIPNVGNDPTDFIGNALKGLFGFGDKSSSEASIKLGELGHEYGKSAVMKLRSKLMNLGAQFNNNDSNLTNSSGVFKLGISNWDTKIGNVDINFTPKELDMLDSLSRKVRNINYKFPPKEFPR